MYIIGESKQAVRDRHKIKSMSSAVKKRLVEVINLLQFDPYSLLFDGETLKNYEDQNVRSFRLNKKDRIVFVIHEENNTIFVYQYLGHYTDK